MYNRPHRRRGHAAVGPGARREYPTDAHEGSRIDFMRRHRVEAVEAVHDPAARSLLLPKLLDRTADLRTLRTAWDYLAKNGGQAPGADGIRYTDLSERDIWAALQAVRMALLAGTYKPARDRLVKIPKPNGKTRTLTLPSIIDRVVGRAVVEVVQPLLDPSFVSTSFAYRPHTGTPAAAGALFDLAEEGRWVWAAADVANAFDSVPRNRLLEVMETYLRDTRVSSLVGTIVGRRGRGIRQGHPLSPLLLNLYLHHHLDVPWARTHPDAPLLRYADDLLLLCRTSTVAKDLFAALTDRCRTIGLPTKPADRPIRDLRIGEQIEWLGFRFGRAAGGMVAIRLSPQAGAKLQANLDEVISTPGGYARTREVILGWVDSLGPCVGHVTKKDVVAETRRAADACGVDGVPSADEVGRRYAVAGRRFQFPLGDLDRSVGGVRKDADVTLSSVPTASPVVLCGGRLTAPA